MNEELLETLAVMLDGVTGDYVGLLTLAHDLAAVRDADTALNRRCYDEAIREAHEEASELFRRGLNREAGVSG